MGRESDPDSNSADVKAAWNQPLISGVNRGPARRSGQGRDDPCLLTQTVAVAKRVAGVERLTGDARGGDVKSSDDHRMHEVNLPGENAQECGQNEIQQRRHANAQESKDKTVEQQQDQYASARQTVFDQ